VPHGATVASAMVASVLLFLVTTEAGGSDAPEFRGACETLAATHVLGACCPPCPTPYPAST
jgi:hypothetical protein